MYWRGESGLFYHFCVLVSDTVQLVPVFVNDDKSVVDFGFLHLFSAFSDLIFPHFALLLTTFTFRLPLWNYSLNFSAHQVLFQLTMIVNVVHNLLDLEHLGYSFLLFRPFACLFHFDPLFRFLLPEINKMQVIYFFHWPLTTFHTLKQVQVQTIRHRFSAHILMFFQMVCFVLFPVMALFD